MPFMRGPDVRGRAQDLDDVGEHVRHIGFGNGRVGAPGTGVGKQIVEQFFHAIDAIAHQSKQLS
jgi:hypothetical protein